MEVDVKLATHRCSETVAPLPVYQEHPRVDALETDNLLKGDHIIVYYCYDWF